MNMIDPKKKTSPETDDAKGRISQTGALPTWGKNGRGGKTDGKGESLCTRDF